jgi:ubiquinone/menaquinone biosynthesis C-methylase UbiE/8-oxo-dGTP pyrophosphatase MutT (NUDIX family)
MENKNNKEIQKQFNKRADEYDDYTQWLNDEELFDKCTEPLNFLVDSIECLDLGGGTGWFAREESKKSGRKWTVLDLSDQMGKKTPKGIEFVHGDYHNTPFPSDKFGFILARSTLQYSNNLGKAFGEIKRILKSEGQIVIAQKFNDNYGEYKEVFKKLTELRNPLKKQIGSSNEFRKTLVQNGFKILKYYNFLQPQKYKIDTWLNRSGTIPKDKQKEIINYIKSLPTEVRKGIGLRIDDKFISYNLSWGIFICAKNIYTFPKTPIVASLIVEQKIEEKDFILLQRRQSYYEAPKYHNTWELPQGKLEEGENITETAIRELLEETGLQLTDFKGKVEFKSKQKNKIVGIKPYFMTHIEGDLNFLSVVFLVSAKGKLSPNIINTQPQWVEISELKTIIRNEDVFPLNQIVLAKYLKDYEGGK